ncbi:MAG TPA: putrescine ABC transporter permease PotH [Holosporales bacterium]|nr:putrescine ABC transporter permease PotH [Holosporales bacterium]
MHDLRLKIKLYIKEYLYKDVAFYTPYLWLIIFLALPLLIIFKISFTQATIALPPFTDILESPQDGIFQFTVTLKNYIKIFTDKFYIDAFASSIGLAFVSTFITLCLGYMMAYGIYKTDEKYQYILLLLVMLPFWTSFLVRVYAWMNMLSGSGIINQLLISLNVITSPLHMLDNAYAVCLGIVYCYLPFMVLPIYTSLDKIDESYSEAASDLGATPNRTFWNIIIPLSRPGIYTGCILVFMPAIGEFVIPELLGGPETLTIGRALWWEFFNNRDWPLACALGFTIVLTLVIPVMIFQRKQKID